MPAAGPVEEGSIVAHVKAELSQFDEAMDRAQARTEKLATTKAEVRVTASVADAEAKIAAVDAAVKKLGDDETSSAAKSVAAQNAVGKARSSAAAQMVTVRQAYRDVAQAQLDETRTSVQLRAAVAALDQALNRSADDTVKVTAAAEAAAAAQAAQERSTLRLAAAQEALRIAEGGDNGGDKKPPRGGGGGGSAAAAALPGPTAAAPLIATGIVALVASAALLAGYLAAVTGAFGMMGAAGVLAVLGIKNAMADGTTAGNMYSAGLQALKGDLDQLSQTSAVSMLQYFQAAVSDINQAMPALNTDVGMFSQILGQTGDILLHTIITGLQTIMPLFIQAGVYVENLAVGFQKWTTAGGLESFVKMAQVGLPQVASAFGSVLSGATAVIGGLAPLGTIILGLVNLIGLLLQGIGWLLNNGFAPLIVGATAAFGAFMLFTKVGPVVDIVTKAVTALGLSVDTALGPIGWVAAAVTGLAVLLSTAAAAADNATQSMDTYTAAVQQDNGVIGDNVKAQAAKNLQSEVGARAAQALGISLKELTDATLGSSSAHAKLEDALKKAQDEFYATAKAGQTNTKAAQDQQVAYAKLQAAQDALANSDAEKKAIAKTIKAYNDLQTAIGGATISTKAQLQAEIDNADQYGVSLSVYEAAKVAQQKAADQLKATTVQMQLQNDAAGLLKNTLDILNGKTLDVAVAQTGLSAANNSLIDSFKQNGQAIDGTSKAAVANQQAIQQSIQQAQTYAEAVGKQTGSTVQATQALSDSKQALEDNLRKYGDLTPAVQAYIDKIFNIPTTVNTAVSIDTAVAETKIDQLAKDIVSLGQSYNITTAAIVAHKLPAIAITKAMGGTIGGYAQGGTPGFAAGGNWGTVYGPGSSTSDSILTRLSRGEEVIRANSAAKLRPFLKFANQYPNEAEKVISGSGRQTQVHNHYPTTMIVQSDPSSAFADFQRRQNLLVA